jgi:4-hydroxy-tetrahydrodipicolinate synthase
VIEEPRIRGIIAAILTPIGPDGKADVTRLLDHGRWLLQHGVHALSLFGTTGEGNSFPVSERREVLSSVVAAGIPPSRLIPAVGCCATEDTVDLLSQAVGLDCAGVLMMPPYYYKNVSEDGVFRAYAEVIEKIGDSRLRLYLYNIPQLTGVTITEGIVTRLMRRYPNAIRGLKDSCGEWGYTQAILKTFPDVDIFTGTEAHLPRLLQAGGAGSISGVANINPAALRRLLDYSIGAEAEDLARTAAQLARVVEAFSGIPALKHLLAHYRQDPAWLRVRPPLEPLSDAQGRSLIAEMQAIGLTPPEFRSSALRGSVDPLGRPTSLT